MTALEATPIGHGTRTRTITWTDPAQSRFRGRSMSGYERLVAMQRGELEMYTRPFLEQYMRDRFGAQERWSQWYAELDKELGLQWTRPPQQFTASDY